MCAHGEPSSSEKFSAKVFCLVLKGPPQPKSACARAVGLASSQVEAFYWLTVAGKVSITYILKRGFA